MIDEIASVASLAKALLLGVDPNAHTVHVQRESFVLLMKTLIDLSDARNPNTQARKDAAAKAVTGHVAAVSTAVQERAGKRER
jgi:hypothetical protein